jgi:PKHD-type hydroxylase
MTALYSKPEAFGAGECGRIIAAVTAVPFKDAMLVGQMMDQSVRRAKLVWVDDVDGLGHGAPDRECPEIQCRAI